MDADDVYDWDAEEARLFGLTDEEAGLLKIARAACDQLNDSLEKNNSIRRWNVLGTTHRPLKEK